MRSPAVLGASLLFAGALAACGGGGAAGSGEPGSSSTFAVVVGDGSGVRVAAGDRAQVLLTVVNAGGHPASFAAEGLPPWARLAGNVISLAPTYEHVGTHVVTITAKVDARSDTGTLTVTVDAAAGANEPPAWHTPYMRDALHDLGMSWTWSSTSDCFGTPWIAGVSLSDDDGDPARGEVEIVPAGATPTGVATIVGPWSNSLERLELPGLSPGQAYDVWCRAIDARGGTRGWRNLFPGLRCLPIGLQLPYLEAYSGEPRSFTLVVHGVPPGEPFTVTAQGLPPWATIDGATLTLSPPAGLIAVRTYTVDFTLEARGYVYNRRQERLVARP